MASQLSIKLLKLLVGGAAITLGGWVIAATLPRMSVPQAADASIPVATLIAENRTAPMRQAGRGSMAQPEQHFIIMMIPHHEDAIAMADLALTRSQHPEIKALARSIKRTQSQENQMMRTWYQAWYGTEVPEWQPGMGAGMGMGRGMGGMMQGWSSRTFPTNRAAPEQPTPDNIVGDVPPTWGFNLAMRGQGESGCMGTNLADLKQAPDFDRAFLEEMIPHHQMGVMMAQMVLARSDRPEIQTLAKAIIQAQTAEIDQMQYWYQEWYPEGMQ